jgi:hypothetical protein
MEFQTEPVFQSLKSLLAVVENAERRRQLEDYIDAARVGLDRALFDVLSRFAEGVNDQVAAHYEVSLNYRPGVLDLDVRPREPGEPAGDVWSTAEGDVEKITLRIPGELKELATEAAAKSGLSVNAWFVRVLARALRGADVAEPHREARREQRRDMRHGHTGSHLTGWVGPEE